MGTHLEEFRGTVDQMGAQFLAALPAHISVDKFKRTVITAVSINPDLLGADRTSLLASCMRAATDGLLLDGRESTLVMFKNQAQYMPMIGGILKMLRQSGEVKSVICDVVYPSDEFEHYRDENGEHLHHRPRYEGVREEKDIALAFAAITTHDGGTYVEVMTREEIEKVRAVSKSGQNENGPWVKWWPGMARKTVLRRLAKRAPTSTDVTEMLARDDADHFDFNQAQERTVRPGRPTRLAALAPAGHHGGEGHDGAPVGAGPGGNGGEPDQVIGGGSI